MSSAVLSTDTPTSILGPLAGEHRVSIMHHARGMSAESRRTFRRLLVLAQERGLSAEIIGRTAVQSQEHVRA